MSRFLVIEGIDGAGKTTLLKGLKSYLQEKGQRVVSTREPGGTPKAEAIREHLFSSAGQKLSPAEQMALVHEGRIDHIKTVILPALNEGATVISDRFEMSSLVYQAWLDTDQLESVYKEYEAEIEELLGKVVPEYVYLTLAPEIVKQRQAQSGDINAFDAVELEPIKDRIDAYEYAVNQVRGILYRIDATPTPDEVLKKTIKSIDE